MNRYNIRIDGEVMPNSYTYEELLMNDILGFDDIEVKQVSKSKWTNIKSFYFPEEHENQIKIIILEKMDKSIFIIKRRIKIAVLSNM